MVHFDAVPYVLRQHVSDNFAQTRLTTAGRIAKPHRSGSCDQVLSKNYVIEAFRITNLEVRDIGPERFHSSNKVEYLKHWLRLDSFGP